MIRNPMPILLGADAPRVLTVPMLAAALSDGRSLPARGTLFNWLRTQRESGVLRPVTRGLYINQLAQPRPLAAEAAAYVRTGAVVSLQTVLGDAGVTNNYSDIVTSVVPIRDGVAPSSRPVKAERIEFRFHAMPSRLLDERAGALEDRLDLNVVYARATSEKALLDWIYLGASPRTIVRAFFMSAAAVGLVGTAVGTALGLLVCANMPSIGAPLAWITGTAGGGSAEVDFITSMPVRVQAVEVASVMAVAIVLSLAAAAYPAWRSTRVEPVEGLRHE